MSLSCQPQWFNPSKAKPAVMAPSPITAMCWRLSPLSLLATDMPRAALMLVELWPTPNVSYALSVRFGNPLRPLWTRLVWNWSRRPVRIL